MLYNDKGILCEDKKIHNSLVVSAYENFVYTVYGQVLFSFPLFLNNAGQSRFACVNVVLHKGLLFTEERRFGFQQVFCKPEKNVLFVILLNC